MNSRKRSNRLVFFKLTLLLFFFEFFNCSAPALTNDPESPQQQKDPILPPLNVYPEGPGVTYPLSDSINKLEIGVLCTLQALPDIGADFIKWQWDTGVVVIADTFLKNIVITTSGYGPANVWAIFNKINSIDMCSSTEGVIAPVGLQPMNIDSSIPISVVVRSGFRFVKWNSDNDTNVKIEKKFHRKTVATLVKGNAKISAMFEDKKIYSLPVGKDITFSFNNDYSEVAPDSGLIFKTSQYFNRECELFIKVGSVPGIKFTYVKKDGYGGNDAFKKEYNEKIMALESVHVYPQLDTNDAENTFTIGTRFICHDSMVTFTYATYFRTDTTASHISKFINSNDSGGNQEMTIRTAEGKVSAVGLYMKPSNDMACDMSIFYSGMLSFRIKTQTNLKVGIGSEAGNTSEIDLYKTVPSSMDSSQWHNITIPLSDLIPKDSAMEYLDRVDTLLKVYSDNTDGVQKTFKVSNVHWEVHCDSL